MLQDNINNTSLNLLIKRTLFDQFLQTWRSNLNNSTKGRNYNVIKDNICIEHYFRILPENLYINMVRFRTGNHKLPIETGRWNNIEYEDRKCTLCDKNTIGNEFQYVLECSYFRQEKHAYISQTYFVRPNMLKYQKSFSSRDEVIQTNLSKFMGFIMKSFA